ncbi:hypothetical protein L6452_31518 [Arctium lappa]|uniref:Uncharacterized protein n=1 Tax=Arctium lappa TaxID=4217 RepID=A0ACB8Z203_ARCLA|nr:hypothetical protein L6452_31518 [Arctium lappa]
MTASRLTLVFIATFVVLASSISAKEYIVGDESVFNYAFGTHNVVKVNGTGFQQCLGSSSNGTLTSGRDVIPLQTPGRKWYICGVAKHCESRNNKLVITVLPQTMAPAPSPMAKYTSSGLQLAIPTFYGFVTALFGSLLFLSV